MLRHRKIIRFILYLLFLISVFSVSYFINNIWREYRKNSEEVIDPTAKVLILGDSHTANGIDPETIGNAVNFADYGESYIHDYYKLKYALRQNNYIKAVILPVDLHSLNDLRNERVLFTGYWDRYIDFPELGKIKGRQLQYLIYKYIDIEIFDFRGEFSALFSQLFKSKKKSKKKKFINKFRGVKNQYFHRNRDRKGEKRALRHYLGAKYPNREMAGFLIRIIKLCKSRGLKLILLRMPVTINYFKVAKSFVKVKNYYNFVKGLIKHYPNTFLLDYHDIFFNKERWKFYDSEHLNFDGAVLFSNILKKKLEDMGVIN